MAAKTLEAFHDAAPVSRALGLRFVAADDDGCRLALTPSEDLTQQRGQLQGGVLAALADQAAATALWARTNGERLFAGADFRLEFLRPPRVGGDDVLATARIEHLGRQRALVDVELVQGDRRIARGGFHFLFPPVEEDA